MFAIQDNSGKPKTVFEICECKDIRDIVIGMTGSEEEGDKALDAVSHMGFREVYVGSTYTIECYMDQPQLLKFDETDQGKFAHPRLIWNLTKPKKPIGKLLRPLLTIDSDGQVSLCIYPHYNELYASVAWAELPSPYDPNSKWPWIPMNSAIPASLPSRHMYFVSLENGDVGLAYRCNMFGEMVWVVNESRHSGKRILAWMPMPDIGSCAVSEEGAKATAQLLMQDASLRLSNMFCNVSEPNTPWNVVAVHNPHSEFEHEELVALCLEKKGAEAVQRELTEESRTRASLPPVQFRVKRV